MQRPLTKILILIAAAVAIYFATTFYLDWRIPRATATVQVQASVLSRDFAYVSPERFFEHNLEREFQAILAQATLAIAAKNIGVEGDNYDQAILAMKDAVLVDNVRGTNLITISAKDPDPQKAARIANAIAEAYSQRRTQTENKRAEIALKALDEELAPYQTRVTDLWKKVEDAFRKGTIPPFGKEEASGPLGFNRDPSDPLTEDYKFARNILREIKIKQQEARVLLKMPRQPVTLHERAK